MSCFPVPVIIRAKHDYSKGKIMWILSVYIKIIDVNESKIYTVQW